MNLPERAFISRAIPSVCAPILQPAIKAELSLLIVVTEANGKGFLGPGDYTGDLDTNRLQQLVHGAELPVAVPDIYRCTGSEEPADIS